MKLKQINVDIKPLLNKLQVGLRRGYSEEHLSASWKSVFKGRGLEFDSYRNYLPTDDASSIDWKASLRAQELMVKILTEERNIATMGLVDVSNSMIFSSTDKLKCEYAGELMATLAFGVIGSEDSAGLTMFNDELVKYIPPNIGKKQMFKIIRAVSNPELYGGGFDFNQVLIYLTNVLKRGTVIFVISDFIGLRPGWKRLFKIASKKFEFVGVMIRDPRDNRLPEKTGQYVLADPYSGFDLLVNPDLVKDKYEELAKQQIDEVRRVFKKMGQDFIMLETDKEFLHPIIRLMKQRVLK